MKAPYDVIFIVCEGGKTKPNYFSELKRYLPAYEKGNRDIFETIQDKIDNAITNARKVEQFHQTSETDNPSTLVHSLVEYLRDLKKQ